MIDFFNEANELFDYMRDLRRDFHRHPELGFQEVRTAGVVARELNDLGLEVSTGVGKTGVVAILEGGRPGPVVLARFDMDALPIEEETGAEYLVSICPFCNRNLSDAIQASNSNLKMVDLMELLDQALS